LGDSYKLKFHQNWLSNVGVMVGQNLPFPITGTLANGLYNSWYYCTSRDTMFSSKDIYNILLCTVCCTTKCWM